MTETEVTYSPAAPHPHDEGVDLTNFLLLKKTAKSIVTTTDAFDLKRIKCRPIPYVGVCIEKIDSPPSSSCICDSLKDLCAGDVIIGVDGESMHLVSMNELRIKTSKAEAELILSVTPVSAAKPILDELQRKKIEGKKEVDLKLQIPQDTTVKKTSSDDPPPPPQKNTATDLSILLRLTSKARPVLAPSRSLGITCRCVPFVGIYIDSVKATSSLQGMVHAGDIIIAVNKESTHLASINEVCVMLSTDVSTACHLSVVPSVEARPLLEALYRKNMEEKKKMKGLFGINDPSRQKQKLHGQSDTLPEEGENEDEAMDLTVLLRLKKVAKTIVAPTGSLGWICRSIPYVGICVEKVLPNSPLVNIVCKGDVIIAVNEQSTHLASINEFIAMASKVDNSKRFFTVAPAWIAQSILESSDLQYTETTGWSRDSSTRVDIESYDNTLALGDRDEIISKQYVSPGREKGKGELVDVIPTENVENVRNKLRGYAQPKPSSRDDMDPVKDNARKAAKTNKRGATPSSSSEDKNGFLTEGNLPEGWTLQVRPRSNSKHIDKYWFTKTKIKLRSKIQCERFLAHLDAADGDEELAYKWLQGGGKPKKLPKKRVTPTKNSELNETDKENGLRGGRKRKSYVEENEPVPEDSVSNSIPEETVENPIGSKRTKLNKKSDGKKIKSNVCVGDRVKANYRLEGIYYTSVVTKVFDAQRSVTVQYDDDGSTEKLGMEDVRLIGAVKAEKTITKDADSKSGADTGGKTPRKSATSDPVKTRKKVELVKKKETRRSSMDDIVVEKEDDLMKRNSRKRTTRTSLPS